MIWNSGTTSMGKPAFWYIKLNILESHLYVIRNKFRPEAQKFEHRKSTYFIIH